MNSVSSILLMVLGDEDEYDTSDGSDDEDSDLEMVMKTLHKIPRVSIVNYFENTVQCYSNLEFIRHFRITRDLFNELWLMYSKSESYQAMLKFNPNRTVDPDKTLAVFLWFAAHEACSFRDISDRFNISTSTVHHIIVRSICFLSNLYKTCIMWPTIEEMQLEANLRERESGIPGVIGCIDCTHIRIDPPAANKDDYIDRKGDTTIILQAVCNKRNKFIDIFVGYPGSVHDGRVFRNSRTIPKLRALPAGYCLLGDSAYPCLRTLLTPYHDNGLLTNIKRNFNKKLSSQRIDIEYSFGILKQRFRQLYYCKLKGPKMICHFIRSCIILHNLMRERAYDLEFHLPEANEENGDPTVDVRDEDFELPTGFMMRDIIAQHLAEGTI